MLDSFQRIIVLEMAGKFKHIIDILLPTERGEEEIIGGWKCFCCNEGP